MLTEYSEGSMTAVTKEGTKKVCDCENLCCTLPIRLKRVDKYEGVIAISSKCRTGAPKGSIRKERREEYSTYI